MNKRRWHYYFIDELKELNTIEYVERDHEDGVIYKCDLCNINISKRKLLLHFRFHHKKIYDEIMSDTLQIKN